MFKKTDAIDNAVSDSCEPVIIPDITLHTVEGKTPGRDGGVKNALNEE